MQDQVPTQYALRDYILTTPEALMNLKEAAERVGMTVFVEVNEKFPPSFPDAIPALASACEHLNVSLEDLQDASQAFVRDEATILARVVVLEPRVEMVTVSTLLLIALARWRRDTFVRKDLEDAKWSDDLIRAVLDV